MQQDARRRASPRHQRPGLQAAHLVVDVAAGRVQSMAPSAFVIFGA